MLKLIKSKKAIRLLSCIMALLMLVSGIPFTSFLINAEAADRPVITATLTVVDSIKQPVNKANVIIYSNSEKTEELGTKKTDENGIVAIELEEFDIYYFTVTATDMFDCEGTFTKTDSNAYVEMIYAANCRTCGAKGIAACSVCNGTGEKISAVSCNQCTDGFITVNCSDCNGIDSEFCITCNGKGTIDEECTDCSGSGVIEVKSKCSNCNGTKEIICTECNGTKYVPAYDDFTFEFSTNPSIKYASQNNANAIEVTKSAGEIIYSSSDDAIVAVDENGNLTAKGKAGESAVITAIIGFDKENGYAPKMADCTVTITKKGDFINEFDIANNLVYNGKSQALLSPKADGDVDTESLTIDIYDSQNIKVDKAVNADTYTVIVTDNNHDEATANIEISRAAVTVIPNNQEKIVGETLDSYKITYEIDGEQNGENIILEGALTYENANEDEEVGDEYFITQDTLKLADADVNKNYELAFDSTKKVTIIDFITDAVAAIKDINTASENYWFNKAYFENNAGVTIQAPEGYVISTKPYRYGSDWKSEIKVSDDGRYDDYRYYLKETATGRIAGREKALVVSFGIDTVCPTADYVEFSVQNDNLLAAIGRTLTFGTFFNKKVEAKVTSYDSLSGVDIVSLKLNDGVNDYFFENYEDGKFLLSNSSEPITGKAYVTVTDKAGNKNFNNNGDELVVKDEAKSNIANSDCFIMIENNLPIISDITITPVDTNRDTEYAIDGKNVYSGDVEFSFSASDADSGLYYTEILINGTDLSVGPYTEKTPSDDYVLLTEGIEANEDGSYILKVTASDTAGNTASKTETIYVDRHAPIVKSFEIKGKTGTADDAGVPHNVILTDYGFYFKNSVDVTVTFGDYLEEKEFLSGLCIAKIYLVDTDNTIYMVKQDGTVTDKKEDGEQITSLNDVTEINLASEIDVDGNSISQFTFTVSGNFKGQIYAMAIDNARNTLVNVAGGSTPSKATDIIGEEISFDANGYQRPSGSIIENAEKHNKSYSIEIRTPKTNKSDYNGIPLYNDIDNRGIDIDLTVKDTYSGIKSIEVDVKAPYNTDENYNHIVTIGSDARDDDALSYSGDDRENDWNIVETEENIATIMSNTIKVTNNSNDIIVTVTLTDRAGNVSSKDYTLSIDKSAPEIEITYNNNVSENGNYYQDDRTATIIIRELNLVDASQIKITAVRDGMDISPSQYEIEDLIKKIYDAKNFNEFHKTKGSEGTEVEYYEFKFTVSGSIQGDYHITAAVTDNAGIVDNYNRVDDFHVDTAAPFITVTFDNENAKNGSYFSSKRTATITVTDRYFDGTKTQIAVSASDNGNSITAPQASEWSNQNGKYEQSCTISFDKDGTYAFTVDATDLSGKSASQYKANDFVIDLTDPTIKVTINKKIIENGSKQAYIEEIEPQVVVEDTNFSQADTTVTLIPAVIKDGANLSYDSTVISKNAEFENGMTYDYNNFKGDDGNQRIYDNIYILEVSTTDKAGNTTTPQKVIFSVNRYGSTYIYNLNEYYTEKPVIQIEEVNVNPIDFDNEETYINVTNSSGITKTLSSKDINIQTQEASENNWYSYLYAIPSETFETDDAYTVKLSSIDTAKRVSTNLNDANKQDISFTVDTTNPYFEVTNYIENENIKESTYELAVDIMDDTSGVAQYNIIFDGEPVGESYITNVYENKVSIKVPVNGATSLSDAAGRELKIEIKDAAGRSNTEENDKKSFNVRISSSFLVDTLAEFQDFYHNTVAFWSTIAGIVLVASAVIWIIVVKKKKSEDNENVK